jgi:hypothetical protein
MAGIRSAGCQRLFEIIALADLPFGMRTVQCTNPCPLLRSLLGVKRTLPIAPQMSAFDRRTWREHCQTPPASMASAWVRQKSANGDQGRFTIETSAGATLGCSPNEPKHHEGWRRQHYKHSYHRFQHRCPRPINRCRSAPYRGIKVVTTAKPGKSLMARYRPK